ncbi:MAG: hypothetical protein IT313_11675 [Anaerolineales bacterium]|nr:hypothetical protein [Anaerolineales bacterium]
MANHTKRILFTAFSILFLVSACLPQPQATPNPVDIANQVATSVALTVSAAQAQTEAAQPVATNTTLPTQTEAVPPSPTVLVPSATPLIIVPSTPTLVVGGGGGGGVVIQPDYDCTPVNNKPRDLTVFKKGNEFDIVWTIVNTGKKIIPAKHDIKYYSGTKLMEDPNDTVREFGVDLKPGESVTIIIDAIAPAEKGKHVMTWRVEGDMCYPYIAIVVE